MQPTCKSRRQSRPGALCARRGAVGLLTLAIGVGLGAPLRADEPPPDVPLDRLLQLPSSVEVAAPPGRIGGMTKAEWQARFAEARGDLETAETALAEAREKLDGISRETSDWKMAAPGLGGGGGQSDAPMNYQLTQEIRKQKAAIEDAEKRLQDLKVKATLAGVPPDWMEPEPR